MIETIVVIVWLAGVASCAEMLIRGLRAEYEESKRDQR
jgi:hypothetical protein